MNKRRIGQLLALSMAVLTGATAAPITVGGVPGLNPNDFRITTFASGLSLPTVVDGATGGGLLVAEGLSNARVVRLVDANGDGLADGPGSTVIQLDSGRGVSSMSNAGPLVVLGVTDVGLRIFAPNADPNAPYTDLGTIQIGYAPFQFHSTPGVTTRATPGQPGNYDVFFSVGSPTNNTNGPDLQLTGLVTGTVPAQSLYKVTLTPNGVGGWTAGGLTQVATGLRNATALGIQGGTGDLYLAENGIDGLIDPDEPESADTLNRVTAGAIGNTVADFGFPNRYTQYRTGNQIGGPSSSLVAFQPLPNPLTGSETEGAAELAFSPGEFPAAVSNGVFLTFFGRGGAVDGLDNEENAVVYYDLITGQYYHFISNDEAGVHFPVGLYSTANSLYLADLGLGTITQISTVPEPRSMLVAAAALALMLARRRWYST